jgi:hypothetical protein
MYGSYSCRSNIQDFGCDSNPYSQSLFIRGVNFNVLVQQNLDNPDRVIPDVG